MGNEVSRSSGKTRSDENNLSEELVDASRKGQVKRIRQLVKKGADVNTTCKCHTPLMTAMYNGQFQSVKALIEAGADVNKRVDVGPRSDTPLSLAGGINKPEYLDLLLKSGADVNKRDIHKRTPLMDLIHYGGRSECKDLLIRAGADVNEPLIYAAELGETDNVKKLLNAGADINHLDQHGITALTRAVQRGACARSQFLHYTACARLLIEAGADVNATGTEGITAMYYVVDTDDEALLRALIKAGKDPHFVSKKLYGGDSVLMKAAVQGNNAFVDLLIEAGADVNDVNRSGSTALMLAALNNHHECVNALIKAGAYVNRIDNEGNTALINASSTNSVTPVRLLLHAGTKINIFNKLNQNALKHHIMDCQSVNRETVRLLVAAGETLDGTSRAVRKFRHPLINWGVNTRNQRINLEDYLEQESTLKSACREIIRKHLLKINPHEHLFHRIPKIGLPAVITRFMLFDLSLDD